MSVQTLNEILEQDAKHVWHPYTQHKISETPLLVTRAEAEFIYVEDDQGKERQIIDGISSWWVNIHGHAHPVINQALKDQVDKFEHVIFAGFTHEPAVELSRELLNFINSGSNTNNCLSEAGHIQGLRNEDECSGLSAHKRGSNERNAVDDQRSQDRKVFFSDNGSTAVEVGMKMAIQHFYNQGEGDRYKILALSNSYHGDTIGTMASSDSPIFHQAFGKVLFEADFIEPAYTEAFETLEENPRTELNTNELETLAKFKEAFSNTKYAALLVEPYAQGVAGMKTYSPVFLKALYDLCKEHGAFFIADEVFTGFGRTGTNFACEQAGLIPDIMAISKGLTAGYMPLGITICTDEVYQAFHSSDKLKTFFHGHSFTGNPLSSAVALASLKLYQEDNSLAKVKELETKFKGFARQLQAQDHKIIKDIRVTGGILAIDFDSEQNNYLDNIGSIFTKFFLERDILLRPLGNTLYFLPPYCISEESCSKVLEAIEECIESLTQK